MLEIWALSMLAILSANWLAWAHIRRPQKKVLTQSNQGAGHFVDLHILSDGTTTGTRLVETRSGLPLRLGGATATQMHMIFRAGDRCARVAIVLDRLPIEYEGVNGAKH